MFLRQTDEFHRQAFQIQIADDSEPTFAVYVIWPRVLGKGQSARIDQEMTMVRIVPYYRRQNGNCTLGQRAGADAGLEHVVKDIVARAYFISVRKFVDYRGGGSRTDAAHKFGRARVRNSRPKTSQRFFLLAGCLANLLWVFRVVGMPCMGQQATKADGRRSCQVNR